MAVGGWRGWNGVRAGRRLMTGQGGASPAWVVGGGGRWGRGRTTACDAGARAGAGQQSSVRKEGPDTMGRWYACTHPNTAPPCRASWGAAGAPPSLPRREPHPRPWPSRRPVDSKPGAASTQAPAGRPPKPCGAGDTPQQRQGREEEQPGPRPAHNSLPPSPRICPSVTRYVPFRWRVVRGELLLCLWGAKGLRSRRGALQRAQGRVQAHGAAPRHAPAPSGPPPPYTSLLVKASTMSHSLATRSWSQMAGGGGSSVSLRGAPRGHVVARVGPPGPPPRPICPMSSHYRVLHPVGVALVPDGGGAAARVPPPHVEALGPKPPAGKVGPPSWSGVGVPSSPPGRSWTFHEDD